MALFFLFISLFHIILYMDGRNCTTVSPSLASCNMTLCNPVVKSCTARCACDLVSCGCCLDCIDCLDKVFEDCCDCFDKCDLGMAYPFVNGGHGKHKRLLQAALNNK